MFSTVITTFPDHGVTVTDRLQFEIVLVRGDDWSQFVQEDRVQTAQNRRQGDAADAAKRLEMLTKFDVLREIIAVKGTLQWQARRRTRGILR